MRRIHSLSIAILLATPIALAPAAAWAGGTGQDACPAGGYTSYFIPDDSSIGLSNAKLQVGGHGWLAPAYLPAGQYKVIAEGDLGPADNPPNAPYLALCRASHGKRGRPFLATAQGHAWANYQAPLAYMVGGAPGTAWLPAGMYRGISSDSTTYATVQRVAGAPGITWWRYVILAAGIVVILAVMRCRSRRAASSAPH
jgi:hypothetical protein